MKNKNNLKTIVETKVKTHISEKVSVLIMMISGLVLVSSMFGILTLKTIGTQKAVEKPSLYCHNGECQIKVSYDSNVKTIEDFKGIKWHNWPVVLEFSNMMLPAIYSPVAGDIDNDGDLEVVVGREENGEIYVFDHEGNVMDGWPIALGVGDGIQHVPALADLDGDGDLEIMVGTDLGPTTKFYVFNYDGSIFPGNWPQTASIYFYLSSPAVGDIDNDGDLEIVIGSGSKVYAWHHNGDLVSGWPQVTGWGISGTPALADLNGDGDLEVIATSYDGKVYVWDHDGSLFGNFPVILDGSALQTSPVVGDVNNDGNLEIVVSTNGGGNIGGHLYVLNSDGTVLSGWPYNLGNSFLSNPSLIDLDNDGNLEIFVGLYPYQIFGFNYNGTLLDGWPQNMNEIAFVTQPVFANADNDVDLEVIYTSSYNGLAIYAWNIDGSLAEGYPIQISDGNNLFSTVSIGDLDSVGDNELLYSYFYASIGCQFGCYDVINVINLNSNHSIRDNLWSMFQHDVRHTGLYTKLLCLDGTPSGQCNPATGNICLNGQLYLIGDLDKNGHLNADDIDLLINYLFGEEPFPEGLPLEVGDTNSDGEVNIGDIVYLINYLYKNGPAPCQTPPKDYQPAIPDKNYTLEEMENMVKQYQNSEL